MHRVEIEELYDKVRSFDLSDVTKKYAADHEVAFDVAKHYEEELKKFLFLSRVYQRGYAMSKGCDGYWHTFILCTQEYTEFCETCFGRYIHHKPGAKDDDDIKTMRYIRFLIDYFRHFKEVPPSTVWPLSEELFGENPKFELTAQCVAPCEGVECAAPV